MVSPAVEATADGLFARIQLATLSNGLFHIPQNTSGIAIEIGTSDRDTLDVMLLPLMPKLFLLSLEPLIDKFARGLARNRLGFGEAFQPLGAHHHRGLVLPIAVDDVGDQPVHRKFNVGGQNTGCSSLLSIDHSSDRLKWCQKVAERREVPVVSLQTLLGWLPPLHPIELLKIEYDREPVNTDAARAPERSID